MVEWSAYRIPVNYREKLIKVNPALSEEEYEKESKSPFKVKTYNYNYRHEDELTEENLRKTFVNLCTTAYFHNKEKRIRPENFNLDQANGKEKEDIMYKMKLELDKLSEMPLHNEKFYTRVNPLHTKYDIWKKNLFVPLNE